MERLRGTDPKAANTDYVEDTAVYDSYGLLRADVDATTGGRHVETDPIGFGGQFGCYTDLETGLVLMTYRYYDAKACRFLTRDPAGYAAGVNPYAYCDGNPVTAADPLGLWSFSVGPRGSPWLVFTGGGVANGVKTGGAALLSDLTLGRYDGGAYKSAPGFGAARLVGGGGEVAALGAAGVAAAGAATVAGVSAYASGGAAASLAAMGAVAGEEPEGEDAVTAAVEEVVEAGVDAGRHLILGTSFDDQGGPGGLQILDRYIGGQIASGAMTGQTVLARNNILENEQGFIDELDAADFIHFNMTYFNPGRNLITSAEYNYLAAGASAAIQAKTTYHAEF